LSAIAGVTGAVGAEFIATLEKRRFPSGQIKGTGERAFGGKTLAFRGQKVAIEELAENSFEGVDIALFSAGGGISRKFAPIAVNAGAVVVDNSSAFRMEPEVPLVIPEINASGFREHRGIMRIRIAHDHGAGALVADPQKDRIKRLILGDLSGRKRCGRCRDGGAHGIDACSPRRAGLSTQRAAAFLRVNLFNHNLGDRPRDRLQRRRDQGHQGDQEDIRRRQDCRRRDLRARTGAARS